ncbi:MAG: RES family NAD+ phosphorylase [Acidimicrobiaceae bacterium]|nr:RES family NAD+ phosphorylase [Acidimicrobiaceae bacterium]MCY3644304.1 RES family NAD+ phosphorylase [Acidimicrobiaceae bacterium]
MLTVAIEGTYCRVADPEWDDPLDPSYAASRGQRWNPPGMECLYLNRDEYTARANVLRRFAGLAYGPEDLDPATAPVLVEVTVPAGQAADAYSDNGLASLGLPHTYPHNPDGSLIPHSTCQPIGTTVLDAGLDGVDYRSAAAGGDRELAWFPRGAAARQRSRRTFDDWW